MIYVKKETVLKKLIILSVLCVLFGCTAVVNVRKCEINVKQGNTDIPCETGYFNFGNIPLNFSQSITFTIENTGVADLHLTGTPKVEVNGQNASDFSAATNLTASTIFAESETTFIIHFKPTSLGAESATVSIPNDDRRRNPYTFAVVGTCTPPAAEIHVKQGDVDILSPNGKFDFGLVNIGYQSAPITFTIENNGNETLMLTGNPDRIAKSGSDSAMFNIKQDMILDEITGGNSTTFDITFKPTTPGIKTAKISILNNDSDENPYTFTITGTASAIPEINVKQGNDSLMNGLGKYVFADVPMNESSAEIVFTIENLGNATLHLTNSSKLVEILGTDAAMFSVNLSSTDEYIGIGSSTTFGITFSPTSSGLKTATVSIANNDVDEDPYTFSIDGNGLPPDINIKQSIIDIPSSTGVYDFYRCLVGASSEEMIFTIENIGSANLRLTGSPIVGISGTNASEFSIDTNSTLTEIPPGTSTTFSITFNPTGTNTRTATVSIANNDDNENPYTFTVKGYGTHDSAQGWIGGSYIGWQTGTAPISGRHYRSFSLPRNVFQDINGYIYIADSGNHRISKWDTSGNAIGWIGQGYDGWQTIDCSSNYGTDYKSFHSPSSVFVDSAGYIYVADTSNHRICKWSSSGNAIGWIGGGSNGWQTGNAPSTYGTDYKSFREPISIMNDNTGNIFIADSINHRICKWSSSGIAIGWLGGGSNGWKITTAPTYGSDYQSFAGVMSIFLDSSGFIYVSDSGNDRIYKWNSSGNAIGWIGGGSNGWKTSISSNIGDTDYQSFDNPRELYINSAGDIYVADRSNYRICKWDNYGNAIGWIGGSNSWWSTSRAPSSSGTNYKSFDRPSSICGNSNGILYIADTYNNRISKWQE